MKKRKLNIFIFFIYMLLLYLLFELATDYFPSILFQSTQGTKYGLYFIAELFWLIMVIITIYIFKNSYVFSQKKEGFFKTLLIGFPLTMLSIIYLSSSIKEAFKADTYTLISLILYAITIGLTEELMIRGWILNEFLERYGNNKKNVILSIFFSALIFGGMHISNIWAGGQTVSETLIQILFAVEAGIFFGALYFRTRNLWAISFLHGFYDFSLILREVNLIKDCVSNETSLNYNMYSLFINGLQGLILVICAIIILRKSKTYEDFEDEISSEDINKSNNTKSIGTIACIVVFVIMINVQPSLFGVKEKELQNSSTCYNYKEVRFRYIETSHNNNKEFTINNNNYNYHFIKDGNKVTLEVKNEQNNNSIELLKGNFVDTFNVIENDNNYILTYIEKISISSGTKIWITTMDKNKNYFEKGDLEILKKSFIAIEMPYLVSYGTLKETTDNYNYVMAEDYMNNIFIIDKKMQPKKVIIDMSQPSEYEELRKNEENQNKLSKDLIDRVPFLNFKYIEYNDAYRGISIKKEEITEQTLLSNLYDKSTKEQLDIPVNLTICENLNPCVGEAYVNNEALMNSMREFYNINNIENNTFYVSGGIVEKTDNYYVYVGTEGFTKVTKVSLIVNSKKDNHQIIISEKAGFISDNTISKYSDIDTSIVNTFETNDEKTIQNYFDEHLNEFDTFTHIFTYDETTKNYNYKETMVNKG